MYFDYCSFNYFDVNLFTNILINCIPFILVVLQLFIVLSYNDHITVFIMAVTSNFQYMLS